MSTLQETDFDIDLDEYEMGDLYFIRMAASNLGNMDVIAYLLDRFLNISNKNRLQNFFRFLKVCVAENYLDFSSGAIKTVFNKLLQQLFYRSNCRNAQDQELKVITLMLLKDQIQIQFFGFIKNYIITKIQTPCNFGLFIFRQTIQRALNIQTGKERGVKVEKHCILRIIEFGFDVARLRLNSNAKKTFSNEEDHILSLSIFTGAIELQNKFVCNDAGNLLNSEYRIEIISSIFEEMLLNPQSAKSPIFVNEVFGLVKQLYKQSTQRIQQVISFQDCLINLFELSQNFGLICPNINQFWNVFINKTNNHDIIWGTVNSISLAILFTKVINQYSNNLCSVNQKLSVVDNLISINNIGTKMHELTQVLNSSRILSNPQSEEKNPMLIMAIQSLYSPLFDITENRVNIFNKLMVSMKEFSQVFVSTHEISHNEELLAMMNLLPAIKILVIKSKKILLKQDYMEILIPFLFTLLNYPQCEDAFEKLINLILNQFAELMPQMNQHDSQKLTSLISWCLQFLNQTKPINMKRSLKFIENMIKLQTNRLSWDNASNYLTQLIRIMDSARNESCQSLFSLMSSIIRSGKIGKDAPRCLKMTYHSIQNNKKYYYIGILFDYGETYSYMFDISYFLRSNQDNIMGLTSNYQMMQQVFRSICFSIMMQIISNDIRASQKVTQSIKSTFNDVKVKPIFYVQICSLVQKQILAFKKHILQHETSKDETEKIIGISIMRQACDKLLNILVDMIIGLNGSQQQGNELMQKVKASCSAASVIFNITCLLLQKLHLRDYQLGFGNIIKKIRKAILHSKFRSIPEFEEGLKYLYTSKMIFETRQFKWKTHLSKVFTKEDYFQMQEIMKLKVKSRSLSDSTDRSCLENMLAYTSCEKYMRFHRPGYSLEK